MSELKLRVLGVIGSLHRGSITRTVVQEALERLRAEGCAVDLLDFVAVPLPLFNLESAFKNTAFQVLKRRVETADVFLLGTPDYHGSMSSVLKNFLDHFWKEFAGKLFVSLVASHEKGLTVMDQLRTVARQCYAWALPYGVAFRESEDVRDDRIVSEYLLNRLTMLTRDVRVYGELLARQRRADLAGVDPGFMAKLRT